MDWSDGIPVLACIAQEYAQRSWLAGSWRRGCHSSLERSDNNYLSVVSAGSKRPHFHRSCDITGPAADAFPWSGIGEQRNRKLA
jgi:hypothetical protein